MTYKTHIAGGVLLTLSLSSLLQPSSLTEVALLYGCTVIGSLLPDIDHPNSKINKYNPIALLISKFVKHRTLTHSLLWMGIVSLIGVVLKFDTQAIIGLNIGILSHLILDMMTVSGVPLFYPYKKSFRIMKLKTNTEHEIAVMSLLIVGIGWLIFK